MRTYSPNSPQAAARIVALALLADGHLCKTELAALERADTLAQLNVAPQELQRVLHTLCEDLLATSDQNWAVACRIDPAMFASLLAEIEDPRLRRKVLMACATVFAADANLADGEAAMLEAAVDQWREPPAQSRLQPVPTRV